nr:MAG TPA: Tumor necrosis factor ligand superfamily receptor complex, IMMUNE RESPONSE.6A [Caudoviricetes sp.]
MRINSINCVCRLRRKCVPCLQYKPHLRCSQAFCYVFTHYI